MQVRARYNLKPKLGLIRISKIIKNNPIEYSLDLFDETRGSITPIKKYFSTISTAISTASLYGFSSSLWEIEEKE